MFPSPLEVNRFISKITITKTILFVQFPSPLEVNRFISKAVGINVFTNDCFRPLSR